MSAANVTQALWRDLKERPLWCLTLVWALSLIWWAQHPPMVDFPQHVAQVSLLKDLLHDRSPWAHEVWINLRTPYLLGYGSSLVMSAFLPVLVGMKLMLTVACLGFWFGAWLLRRRCGAPRELDWLAITAFLGFAYHWGFFTFLVSSPLLLLFVLLVDRSAQTPSRWVNPLGVVVVGLMLLSSHGLMFVFAWSVGAALLSTHAWRYTWHERLLRAAPMALLAVACLGYVAMAKSTEQGLGGDVTAEAAFNFNPLTRLAPFLTYPLDHKTSKWVMLACLGALAAPWLMGLRPRKSLQHPGVVLFAVTVALFFVVPGSAMGTGFIYERFALFILPAYACLFQGPVAPVQGPWPKRQWQLGLCLLVGCAWLTLASKTLHTIRYERHAAGFEQVLDVLEPGQRALYLPLSRHADVGREDSLMVHFGSYYQAQKSGLVDFNFAWFPPQVVRFQREFLPPVKVGFEWNPSSFDWAKHRGERYRYFVFHGGDLAEAQALMAQSPCGSRLLLDQAPWRAFERLACAKPS